MNNKPSDLVAQLVQANYNNYAVLAKHEVEAKDADIVQWAKDFADLYDAMALIPPMSRSVYIDHHLELHGFKREYARQVIEGGKRT